LAALDTNVLVRFLVQDDPAQGKTAAGLIRSGIEASQPLFVPITVLLALE
jgi:predicted nucleic-acid-binding protein